MTETDISTTAKYYDYVKTTVDVIENKYHDYPERPLSEMVFETVDSSDIIMYYGYNMDILQNSNSNPEEWKHLVGEDEYWKDVIQAMAFDVFRIDVWDEIHARDSIDY